MSVKIDGYPIDLAISETYKRESEATKYPVEKGSDITDHVKTGPRSIEFEGVVSDTPIGAIKNDTTRTSLDGTATPSRDAFTRLEALQDTPRLVTVECSLGKFENMLLISLNVPRDQKTTKGLKFTVSFEQITLVQNNRTTVRVAVPNGGKGKAYLGNKESKEWAASLGVKDAIFVVSIRTDLSETWAKSWGTKPLMRRGTSVFNGDDEAGGVDTTTRQQYDCFEVIGDAQPDGFLTTNNTGSSTQKYTYHPLSDISSMGGTPTDNSRGIKNGSSTNVGTAIGNRPVHYDYSDGTWKDDRDNSVVRRVPKGDDRWKGVTVTDPKGHRQTF